MFKKILVANRGEIALRVIRACKELDIKSIAVYSEADTESLHLCLADEQVLIGPPLSAKSYLSIENLMAAARETGADAVHPGYGYLAENEEFARACQDQGLVFIGPTAENLRLAGDKIAGKKIMEEAGVPVIPSGPGAIANLDEAKNISVKIGYPVMIKASGGGGGRGIRICKDEKTLEEEFPIAKMEAGAAFGNDELYIEKFIVEPRHIEFQVLADTFGNICHLGERECSIQRRFQKLIEEAPSPRLTPELRRVMGEAAMTVARAVNYVNAGTVEFLVDKNDNFYFMEVNARIQVEHPVTELTTGIDLVKEQIKIAAGERLAYTIEDLDLRGWAIECRINAEDPEKGFMPSPGTVEKYNPPGGYGVRLDTHLYQGYELPIYYDSLIAKLITFDSTREGAIRVMKRALEEFRIEPLKTTIPFCRVIMEDADFQRGEFTTDFIKKFIPDSEDEDDEDEDDED
ncbi:MAG: acetyl-CoA carboxylase biotin carboxylase subunit [Deltaproteobacteria bacterium]|nr:acetyl-CoA carboxylase biotin carboxylase subunit [Deltaproteobacteria bacterium]MBW2051884.1 acetyl-CoA carboxylase biotin carboxylase subunit [Deltaproteobacteria bacterium]MBW2141168.1 acetyl-CoA carboxylase biotin carboxylase subunit [Deltaproteobacteria bacterium]MBW2322496.1 acetyl-CoA carboxylase biotin carboxylase subunit [Deltaproteobacteria bacterium]